MGLGAAGILDWQTAVAFSLGADLGTTITSWMASWTLSKNAKRAAYAHISFNFIGVAVMLPLFFVSMEGLKFAMQWFGGDPGVPVIVNGKETFPLVPVAVGLYSTVFNVFNTLLLFPFVGLFEKYLSRIGHSKDEEIEDYSVPRYLSQDATSDFGKAANTVRLETERHLGAATLFLATARGDKAAPADPGEHYTATDVLSRDIRGYAARLFKNDMPYERADLVASLIEEADFTASLAESLHQVARRVKREAWSQPAREIVDAALSEIELELRAILPNLPLPAPSLPAGHVQRVDVEELRRRVLNHGPAISAAERGSILALLGSVERARLLIVRIDAERRSVDRERVIERAAGSPSPADGALRPQPAE
jgi:phosphate:Na+ symporter